MEAISSPTAVHGQPPLVLFGTGGHGKVIFDAACSAGLQFDFLVDDQPSIQEFHGKPVLKSSQVPWDQWPGFNFVVAIGDNSVRAKIWQLLLQRGGKPVNIIHRGASVSPHAQMGQGNFVAAGAVVGIDAVIGDNCIINTGATVDHDCRLASHAHLGPGVHLAGRVQVGAGALLGVGVSVVPGVTIGEWSVIGAGSTVIQGIPDHVVAFGSPARMERPRDSRLAVQ